MGVEVFGGAQFKQILEQRDHEDRMANEVIKIGNEIGMDFSEFMIEDILRGNTHTITHFYRISKINGFEMTCMDGTGFWQGHKPIDVDLMPIVPIKADNTGNISELPVTDPLRMKVDKSLSALDMKFEDIAEGILTPKDIPAIYRSDGTISNEFMPYWRVWDNNLLGEKTEFPTIEAYRNNLVKELGKQRKSIKDITDVFVGMFATAQNLNEASRVAVFFTMAKILPFLTNNTAAGKPPPEYPTPDYLFELGNKIGSQSSFTAVCGMSGWTYIERAGKVHNEWDKPGEYKGQNRKSSHNIYFGDSANKLDTDGDPIIRIIGSKRPKAHAAAPTQTPGGPTLSIHGKQTMIEIRVEIGENIYGEIRMWDYETMHWITKDNQKKGSAISGGLRGVKTPNDPSTDLPYPDPSVPYDASWDKATCEANGYFFCPLANACLNKAHNSSSEVEDLNSEDYKDIVIFPISYKATKKVPIFERERLMRESVILSVYSLTVIKTKWYQSGVFKAVLFVFAIIITVVAPYLAGVAWKAIITSVVKMAIIAAVSGVILQMIDNPFIAAILVVVLAVYTMNPELASMSFEQMALIGMEAANTYVAKYYAQKMEEIQKEFEEFKEKMKAAEEELEDLQEEVGILRNDATEWVKQIAQFPPVESAEDSLSRTTDVNNAIIDDVDNMTDVTLLLPAMTTKQ